MKNNFYFLIIASSILLTFKSCAFTKEISSNIIEFYITPRNVNYGWADQGIYRYNFEKKSIKVPYSKVSYTTSEKKDSLYELFYCQRQKSDDLLKKINNSYLIASENEFSAPRIMILFNKSKSHDTLIIDNNYNVSFEKKIYQIDNELKTFLIDLMPSEMQESWIYNKMRR